MSRQLCRAALAFFVLAMLAPDSWAGQYDRIASESRRLRAAKALDEGAHRQVRSLLEGLKDRESYMLMGKSAYEERRYALAAVNFDLYLQASDAATTDPKERAAYIFSLEHLVQSYYMDEQHGPALGAARRLMSVSPTREHGALLASMEQRGGSTTGAEPVQGLAAGPFEQFEARGYNDAVAALKEKRFRDVLINLRGDDRAEARLIKGFAHYGLEEYLLAAIELEAGRESTGDYRRSPENLVFMSVILRQLMMAHYRSDDLPRSLEVAEELAALQHDDSVHEFIVKLRREMKGSENQVSESTAHFKAIYDGYEHGKVDRVILSILEDAYRDIGQKMDHFPSAPITVVLHTGQNFRDVTRAPGWAGGVFMDGRIRIPVAGVESFDPESVRRILYHEYVHALVYSLTRRSSRWMHEGLAEYYTRGPEIPTAAPSVRPDMLDSLFNSGSTRVVAAGYIESRNTVKVLMDNHGLHAIKKYLSAMGSGSSSDDAFRSAFYLTGNDFMEKYGRKR